MLSIPVEMFWFLVYLMPMIAIHTSKTASRVLKRALFHEVFSLFFVRVINIHVGNERGKRNGSSI
jgi:hypothetical protein